MKAIISAAGWKGAGDELGLGTVPEPFLPLGDESCTLSKLANALIAQGFELYIAIGKRGYPFHNYRRGIVADPQSFDWWASPWTQERYDYAAQFGTVLEMPDPGGWSTSIDTFCLAMDMIGADNWDDLLLACGDTMVPTASYARMFEHKKPWVLTLTAHHAIFYMDQAGAEFWREYAEPFRRFNNQEAWKTDKSWAPNYNGVIELRKQGFDVFDRIDAEAEHWTDVDVTATYKAAIKLISDGKIDEPATKRKTTDPDWYRWDGGWYENDGENIRYCVWDGLGKDAVVFDIGSYEGEWISRMVARYPNYQYYGFEPSPRAFEVARKRLADCGNVNLYNFGLGVTSGMFRLHNDQQDAATFLEVGGTGIDAEIMNIREFLESEDIECVELAVINVEGWEFELLPYLIASTLIRRFKRLMIQWHYVVPNAGKIRMSILGALAKTHAMAWNHGTWEAWEIKAKSQAFVVEHSTAYIQVTS